MDIDGFNKAALRFRKAIDLNAGCFSAISLSDFPQGACGDGSTLLGLYLEESLGVDVEYVAGVKGVQHHAWIEHDGLIIDISADQFEGMDSVIVQPVSQWHQDFNIQHRRRPCIDTEIPKHRHDLERDFQRLRDTAREMA
ncbi:hypothetical protein [Rhodopirellula bahusiensis]|uniref:Microcin J25-processing protein McjB C-terminal domain-containing protein n=1 Tax=Rhodopirellula bahusiensis TaxID=2014065 RepID=A0A2G1W703_9BACT|nr:hypothetical protein [Rhodopirellula bahusiensis]PHQ34812.1 hypothetical protein CEE69_13140 [Rhodopirellula bahusiensis]